MEFVVTETAIGVAGRCEVSLQLGMDILTQEPTIGLPGELLGQLRSQGISTAGNIYPRSEFEAKSCQNQSSLAAHAISMSLELH